MATFKGINKTGQVIEFEAGDVSSALLNPDLAPSSGVQAVQNKTSAPESTPTGITPKISLPDLETKSSSNSKSSGPSIEDLFSASKIAVDRDDIEIQTERELGGAKSSLISSFDTKIRGLKEDAGEQRSTLEGKLGTRRRFSSSAEAFIKFVDDKNNEQIADLEANKEAALADFDFKMAALIDQRIAARKQESQQEFANAIKIFELAEKQRDEEATTQAALVKTANEGVIANALQEFGATDKLEIFRAINFDQNGKQIRNITADEIDGFIESIYSGSAEPYKNLSSDFKDFFVLRDMGALPAGVTTPLGLIAAKKGVSSTSSGHIGGAITGQFPGIGTTTATAINDALEGMKFSTVDARERADSAIRQKLLSGDIDGAKSLILQYAKNSFGESTAQVIVGYEQGQSALNLIEKGLKELENAKIDTNIFTSIAQKSLDKIGKADYDGVVGKIGDPRLAKVANDIALAIISYRRAVSGAAFTESEGRAYENAFPSIGKEKDLNTARIQSLRDSFRNGTDAYLRFRITGYDDLFSTDVGNSDVTTVDDSLVNKLDNVDLKLNIDWSQAQ